MRHCAGVGGRMREGWSGFARHTLVLCECGVGFMDSDPLKCEMDALKWKHHISKQGKFRFHLKHHRGSRVTGCPALMVLGIRLLIIIRLAFQQSYQ